MPQIDIRPAETHDYPAVLDMWMALQQLTDSYPPQAFGDANETAQRERLGEMLANSLDTDIGLVLVAAIDDTPVGTLSIYLSDKHGYHNEKSAVLFSVWVNPEQRRDGIASRLLQQAREWAKVRGACSLQVGWHPGNPKANAFWNAHGFSGYEVIGARSID